MHGLVVGAEFDAHHGGHAQAHVGIVLLEREAHRIGTGGGVCCGRNLTHRCVVSAARQGPERDLRAARLAQGIDTVFGHAERHFLRRRARDAHHRRTGGHHLPDLGIDAGHHARRIGHEGGVTGLVGLAAEIGGGLLLARTGTVERGLAPVELGLADEILRKQIAVTVEVGLRKRKIGIGRVELRLGSGLREREVLHIQAREHFAGLHGLADVDATLDQFAADPESEPRFDSWSDLARISRGGVRAAERHHLCAYRTDHLGRLRLRFASRERRQHTDHDDHRQRTLDRARPMRHDCYPPEGAWSPHPAHGYCRHLMTDWSAR